jgi:hypothetical protein
VKQGIACVVFDANAVPVTVVADMAFDADDPIVREHPDWFQLDAKAGTAPQRITAVSIEDASAAPGHLRNR